jgi:hypothetical protein
MNASRLVASILAVSMVACGGDGGDSNAAGGSSGHAAGGSSAGSSSISGSTSMAGTTTSGGSTGSAGNTSGGSAPSGQHCAPGTPQPAYNFFGGIVDQCPSVNGLTGNVNHILDIELPKPIGPGDTFAFSVNMKAPEGDFEVYGTTRECGDVAEKLSAVHVLGNGIICHAAKPVTGTYSHLIWIWRVAGEMVDAALCEDGTCPAR